MPIISVGNNVRSGQPLFHLHEILRYLRNFDPGIIISSLDYGIINVFYRKAKRIYYLHGFPTRDYGYLRFNMVLKGTKLFSKYSDVVIANSSLTKMVNKEIYGIKNDLVINPGVSNNFLTSLKHNNQIALTEERKPNILYTGRLVKAKKIDKLIEALKIVTSHFQGVKLLIIGDGPEKENILESLRKSGILYEYHGRLSQSEIANFYVQSRVFVSLNSHEPFGITYLEAILSGCNVVCSSTGGHVDFSPRFSGQFYYVKDIENPKSVAESIICALTNWKPCLYSEDFLKQFSYETVAMEILHSTL